MGVALRRQVGPQGLGQPGDARVAVLLAQQHVLGGASQLPPALGAGSLHAAALHGEGQARVGHEGFEQGRRRCPWRRHGGAGRRWQAGSARALQRQRRQEHEQGSGQAPHCGWRCC